MPQMLGYLTQKKKKRAYANTFNWHFCIFHSIVDSLLQLIVQFVSSLISMRAFFFFFFGWVTVWG